MYELDRTLIMKQPAEVIRAAVAPPSNVIVMTTPYVRKADLIAAVRKQARRGEVRPLIAGPRYNGERGEWEWPVERLRPAQPAWIRPAAIILAALTVLGSLGGLLAWVLTSLAAAPLALFLLACLGALMFIARVGKRQTVNITNNVTMR